MSKLQSLQGYKGERTKIHRENLRKQIDGEQAILGVVDCVRFLQGVRSIELDASTGQYLAPPPVDSSIIAAVKAEADLHIKLLNKVLPDLKPIEQKDLIGEPVNGRLMSKTELVHRLRHLGMDLLGADDEEPESLF